jgi:hypothetical protein
MGTKEVARTMQVIPKMKKASKVKFLGTKRAVRIVQAVPSTETKTDLWTLHC